MRPVCQLMIFQHFILLCHIIQLKKKSFQREGSPYLACNERNAFFISEHQTRYKLLSCQNMCEALTYLLDNIFIRFGTKLYRQIDGIPMGTSCAPLIADLFLFCYERDFMATLYYNKEAEIIQAFNSTSTGCLKKTWTFFENAITPPFIKETFSNFLWL